jgi:hypothetical protein
MHVSSPLIYGFVWARNWRPVLIYACGQVIVKAGFSVARYGLMLHRGQGGKLFPSVIGRHIKLSADGRGYARICAIFPYWKPPK